VEFLLNHPWPLGLIAALLLAGTIEAGYRVAVRTHIQESQNRKEQMGAIRDSLFVLVSLLLGFTLALAAPRYAERRSLLIEEANAIGSTYRRAGILPEGARDQARRLLQEYVDTRLDLDTAGLDAERAHRDAERARQIQEGLWETLIECTKEDRSAVTAAYMNSLIETIDLHEKRISAFENRVPRPVWLLIFCVALIAVFARGSTLSGRFWLTLLIAPLTVAIVIALIADLDSPGSGLIRLDQRAMIRLKAEIGGSH
jgi:hypothetical protein